MNILYIIPYRDDSTFLRFYLGYDHELVQYQHLLCFQNHIKFEFFKDN